jgi:glycosyltransferase involved in cell wall biosynthesis
VLPVSVIIPTYNAAAFIREALWSIARQNSPPAEVIVVDDGSTDGSAAIAETMGASVLTRPHEGLSAARNAGIRTASQEWIALLDADDLWEPGKLECQWLAVSRCPDVGMVFTDFTEFSDDGIVVDSFLGRLEHYRAMRRTEVAPGIVCCDAESLQRQFAKGNFIAPSTFLARRDLFLQVGLFDTRLSHMEDRECWLRFLNVAKAAVVERALVRARVHSSNMSHDGLRMAVGAATIAELVLGSPERYPPAAVEQYRRDQSTLYLNAGRFAEAREDLRLARQYYLRAWRARGGLRPLVLSGLCRLPRPVRMFVRRSVRLATGRRKGTA